MTEPITQDGGQGYAPPACSAFDEDGERMPTEHEAFAAASALIEHYEPTPDLAGSDFDKGMQALQRLMGLRPNARPDAGREKGSHETETR